MARRRIRLPWYPSPQVEQVPAEVDLDEALRQTILVAGADGEGNSGAVVSPTAYSDTKSINVNHGLNPMAPWESPGGGKMFIDPKSGESLSVLTNWDTAAAIVVATAGGAIALASIVTSGGAGTRIQIGNVYFSSSSGANTTQVEFKEETSGNVAAAFTRVSSGGWSGYLLADDKDLQIEASGLTASCTNSYMLQYRVLVA